MNNELLEAKQEAKELGIKTSGFRVNKDSQGEITVSCGRFESSGFDVTECRIYVINEMISDSIRFED